MAQPEIRVQLLGAFAVYRADGSRAGPWGRPPARRLVALLALSPGFRLTREQAAEALFPALPPPAAANALAKAASMARSAMGRSGSGWHPLSADRSSIWLEGPLAVDAAALRARIAAALDLAPGRERDARLVAVLQDQRPLLPDEPYADWAAGARDDLERRRHEARLALARDRARGHGVADPAKVVAAWSAVALAEPTSEEAAAGLMRVYDETGQRDRAMRAYLRCRAAVREQLGVEPGRELERAYRALALSAGPAAARAGEAAEWMGGRRLVGRDALLRALRRRLARAQRGDGSALLLAGPAGIGKSLLLRSVANDAERAGWRVLFGAATSDDSQAPYASLGVALAGLGPDERAPEALDLLALLAGGTPRDDGGGAELQRARISLALGRLLDRLALDRPVLLALDDVQWADSALQSVLRRIAVRPGARRWTLVAAARNDEPGAPVRPFGGNAELVEIPPLSPRATAAVVRAALAADGIRRPGDVVGRAAESSQGNPFFAIELARSAAQEAGGRAADPPSVPDAIVALLRRRFAALSDGARTLLSLAALAGMETTYELLHLTAARIGVALDQDGLPALDELIEARIVLEVGDKLVLAHPLLRDAAISTTNAVRRSAVHAAIAESLEEMGNRTGALLLESAARHRLAAFTAARLPATAHPAATAGFRAGQQARRMYADDAASALLRGALEAYAMLAPASRRELAGDAMSAWLTVGHIALDRDEEEQAQRAYEAALAIGTADMDIARGWSALAGIPYRHGRLRDALRMYRRGLRAMRGASPVARARLESDAAWLLIRLGRTVAALRILRRVEPLLLDAPEVHIRCRLQDRLGMALAGSGRREEALAAYDRGVGIALEHGDDRELMVLLMHRAPLLSALGRQQDALADARRAADVAELAQDRYSRAVTHWITAEILEREGAVEQALDERTAEVELLLAIDNPRNLAIAQSHRARLEARLGRTDASAAAARAARSALRRVNDPRLTAAIEGELADTAAAPPSSGKDSGIGAR